MTKKHLTLQYINFNIGLDFLADVQFNAHKSKIQRW